MIYNYNKYSYRNLVVAGILVVGMFVAEGRFIWHEERKNCAFHHCY